MAALYEGVGAGRRGREGRSPRTGQTVTASEWGIPGSF